MKIGVIPKFIENSSGESDNSNIHYYFRTEELLDVLETAQFKIGDKSKRGKSLCLS
jgi:hypothetical protein